MHALNIPMKNVMKNSIQIEDDKNKFQCGDTNYKWQLKNRTRGKFNYAKQ